MVSRTCYAIACGFGANEFENGRVWKRIDFAVMDRLYEQGYISDPHGMQESVNLTEKGLALAKTLAAQYFAIQLRQLRTTALRSARSDSFREKSRTALGRKRP